MMIRKRGVAGVVCAVAVLAITAAGLSAAAAPTQTGPLPGFNPYGTPVNGCGNPILETDTAGWSTLTPGMTAARGLPGDHVVAGWDYNARNGDNTGPVGIGLPPRPVAAGQTWEFSADVRTGGDPAQARVEVDWLAGAALVGHDDGAWFDVDGARPYLRIAATETAPPAATVADVIVRAQGLDAGSGIATTMCTYLPKATPPPPTTTVPPTTVPPTTVPPTTVPPTTTAGPPPGTVLFNGDFETGNFNQWPLCQTHVYNNPCTGMPGGDYALTIEHPGFQGNSAARLEVHDGDQPFCCGERAQLVGPSNETEGRDLWYSWDVKVDTQFPTSNSWQVLMQWHSTVDGSPPLNFLAENNNIVLETRPRPNQPYTGITNVWTGPLDKGVWHAYQVHVRWSSNANIGLVELWRDGVRQTFTATPPENSNGTCAGTQTCHISDIYPGDPGNRPMLTYYRDAAINGVGVVHHDGFRVATTQQALG